MASTRLISTALAVATLTSTASLAACSTDDSKMSQSTSATAPTFAETTTPVAEQPTKGIDSLVAAQDRAQDPTLSQQPVYIHDGTGTAHVTGLNASSGYTLWIRCAGGGAFKTMSGTRTLAPSGTCDESSTATGFDVAHRDIGADGTLDVVFTGGPTWTVGVWKKVGGAADPEGIVTVDGSTYDPATALTTASGEGNGTVDGLALPAPRAGYVLSLTCSGGPLSVHGRGPRDIIQARCDDTDRHSTALLSSNFVQPTDAPHRAKLTVQGSGRWKLWVWARK